MPSPKPPSAMPLTKTIFLADESATQALAEKLAPLLQAGMRLYFSGDLGAGKTTSIRALLAALGYSGRVKSPTYALVESYDLPDFVVHHFDLYRFSSPQEWFEAGFDDYFSAQSLCLIEWPSCATGVLPPPDLDITLVWQNHGRQAIFSAHTDLGQQCLAKI